MLKKLAILSAAILLPITPAQAASKWNISIPNWVTELSNTLTGNVEARPQEHKREVACLALAVYYEARGESERGQRAVASVVMNRVHDKRFPDTACEVVFQPKQFSFIRGQRLNPTDKASWAKAVHIGNEYADRTQTDNNYLFFSSEGYLKGTRIGNHIFRR